MSIANRLKAERERLGLSQSAFGGLGGCGKTTVIAWERGDAYPNAAFLAAIAEGGADVRYIVTGERDWQPYTVEEQQLVNNYRAVRSLLPKPAKKPKKPHSATTIHAPGGHVVGRDLIVNSKEDKKNE